MGWIYLAGLEGSHLPCDTGSSPSPTVKTIDTLNPSYFLECLRVNYIRLQYGTTSELSEVKCSLRSIWSTEAFPAKTSVLLGLEKAWSESEVDFSGKSSGLSKKQTRDLFFSKTSQQLELVASTVSRKHLPNSGMIVDGRLFQPQKLEPRTLERDGSYWPTPKARDWKDWNYKNPHGRESPGLPIFMQVNFGMWPTVHLYEWLMNYPDQWTKLEDWATQWFQNKQKKLF